MKEINKELLERLREDEFSRRIASYFDLDLDRMINDVLEDIKKKEKIDRRAKEIVEESTKKSNTNTPNLDKIIAKALDELEKEGVVRSEKHNGEKYYYADKKKPYEAPKAEVIEEKPNFAMSYEQFKKFIEDYSAVLNAVKKIDYFYGVKLDNTGSGFTLSGKVSEIIWDLIRIIFGEENREDIADYLYGNSNFDSPKALYNELT